MVSTLISPQLSGVIFLGQPRPLILQKNGCPDHFLVISDDY